MNVGVMDGTGDHLGHGHGCCRYTCSCSSPRHRAPRHQGSTSRASPRCKKSGGHGLRPSGRGDENGWAAWRRRVTLVLRARRRVRRGGLGSVGLLLRARGSGSNAKVPPGDTYRWRAEGMVEMDVVFDRVAGLDIGKASVTVCVRTPGPGGGRRSETRTFRTMTRSLGLMADWLEERGVTLAAMESTATYWKPVFYCLEEHLECWLLNAAHMKAVPGRKSDVKDAEWIAWSTACCA